MAVSAFKSTSRRGNVGTSTTSNSISSTKGTKSEELGNKMPHRRSRSVSAVSRRYASSAIDEFSNKRDNPLFCSTNSSPDAKESEKSTGIGRTEQNATLMDQSRTKLVGSGVLDARRGRSVSRVSDGGNHSIGTRKELGRSLSRVDTGRRRRSLSRGHYENSESDNEYKYGLSSTVRNKGTGKSRPCTPSDVFTPCAQAAKWEDGVSTSSLSEAEEKTIRAVSEQMKAFPGDHPAGDTNIYETVQAEVRRAVSEIQKNPGNAIRMKNPTMVAATNFADIPPELVNPETIDLVSEIRREYVSKFSQSQERARKLQADLAVEKQRGQEFNRILTEILPEPRSAKSQNSHPRRKTSIERSKMSRRLTEEAMNYFDECVSISTFDGSDFSSTEDPPNSLLAGDPAVGDDRFFPLASSSASAICISSPVNSCKESDSQVEMAVSHNDSNLTISSKRKSLIKNTGNLSGMDTAESRSFHFSFDHEPTEVARVHNDVRNYIKMFKKNITKDSRDFKVVRFSHYDADDYELQLETERLLFETVVLKKKIESGSLLICSPRSMF